MAKITLEQLDELGACHFQRALFYRHFGEEVEVTMELAYKYRRNFNWFWAAMNLLPKKEYSLWLNAAAPGSDWVGARPMEFARLYNQAYDK